MIFEKFGNCKVGITITPFNEDVKIHFKLHSSSISAWLAALKTINDNDLISFTFRGPLVPDLAGDIFREQTHQLNVINVNRVILDRFNKISGN